MAAIAVPVVAAADGIPASVSPPVNSDASKPAMAITATKPAYPKALVAMSTPTVRACRFWFTTQLYDCSVSIRGELRVSTTSNLAAEARRR